MDLYHPAIFSANKNIGAVRSIAVYFFSATTKKKAKKKYRGL